MKNYNFSLKMCRLCLFFCAEISCADFVSLVLAVSGWPITGGLFRGESANESGGGERANTANTANTD